jgi:hypothetical protein
MSSSNGKDAGHPAPEGSAGGLLTKQQIVVADDIITERVPVPGWGGDVLVRGLTGTGRDAYFKSMARTGRGGQPVADPVNATAKLCALCIIDPATDRPMFSPGEIELLGRKSAASLHRVEEVAMRLSGLSDEDMEELGKASASTPSEAFTSA